MKEKDTTQSLVFTGFIALWGTTEDTAEDTAEGIAEVIQNKNIKNDKEFKIYIMCNFLLDFCIFICYISIIHMSGKRTRKRGGTSGVFRVYRLFYFVQ